MKNQALYSLKDKSKKLKCCLLQFFFGALRVKMQQNGASDQSKHCLLTRISMQITMKMKA